MSALLAAGLLLGGVSFAAEPAPVPTAGPPASKAPRGEPRPDETRPDVPLAEETAPEAPETAPKGPAPAGRPAVRVEAREALAAVGLAPDGSGAAAYLAEYRSSLSGDERARRLVAQLGDPDYVVREAATDELLRLPLAPLTDLKAARASPDVEVAYRAGLVLDRAEPLRRGLLRDCWHILAVDPRAGAVDDLFATADFDGGADTVRAAGAALAACLTVGGVDPARRQVVADHLTTEHSKTVRRLAVVGAAALDPEAGDPLLLALLDDPDDDVRLDALTTFARRADRRAIEPLVALLDRGRGEARGRAFWMLYGLTGETNGYSPYATPQERRAGVDRWRDWVAAQGEGLTLRPLGSASFDGRGELAGHTLIATGGKGEVYELDAGGRRVFEFPVDSWSAEKLPGGNILVANHDAERVLEVDFATRAVVWEKTGLSAISVKPLDNGHVLVADFSRGRAVELNTAHEVVWEAGGHDDCFDVERLPDGNTLVGCPNVIKEITPGNAVVKTWPIEGRLNGFQLQPDGHLLVANWGAKEVQEYDAAGAIVWRHSFKDRDEGPCDAFRSADGTLLIATDQRVLELSADGKTVTELGPASYGSVRR